MIWIPPYPTANPNIRYVEKEKMGIVMEWLTLYSVSFDI
jgi:hypothetical protein